MTKEALIIIDAQRGFMPAEEGQRLGAAGFGELPVTEGEQIIPVINRLVGSFATLVTTQDWHPHQTAHFSDNPNFVTDWPVHCVDGTSGAELHPELELPAWRERFIKGFEPLENGEDDTSYSAHYAEDPILGISLPEWLKRHKVTSVYLAGLALDYCVGKSAIDFKVEDGLDVTVVLDATRGIAENSVQSTLEEFKRVGVKTISSEELLAQRAA